MASRSARAADTGRGAGAPTTEPALVGGVATGGGEADAGTTGAAGDGVGGGPKGIGAGGIAGPPDIGIPPPPSGGGAADAIGAWAALVASGFDGAAEAAGGASTGVVGAGIGADAGWIGGPLFDILSAIGGGWYGGWLPEPVDGPDAPLEGSTLGWSPAELDTSLIGLAAVPPPGEPPLLPLTTGEAPPLEPPPRPGAPPDADPPPLSGRPGVDGAPGAGGDCGGLPMFGGLAPDGDIGPPELLDEG